MMITKAPLQDSKYFKQFLVTLKGAFQKIRTLLEGLFVLGIY